MKSRTSELLTCSKNVGSVVRSSEDTGASSLPASPKYSVRKSLSSVLLLRGFVRFWKAAMTSSRGRLVGLDDAVSQNLDHMVGIVIELTGRRRASNLQTDGLIRSPSRSRLDSTTANHKGRSLSHSGRGRMPMATTKARQRSASW